MLVGLKQLRLLLLSKHYGLLVNLDVAGLLRRLGVAVQAASNEQAYLV